MRRLHALVGALGLLLGLVAGALPADAARIMVVIDGSGSAAGRIDGTAKLDIARSALGAALNAAPGDLAIGIAAYGHRQRETCSDFEVLAPPGPASAAITAAATIQAVGRSPIADATVAAAEAFGDPNAEATIIVITDNADNCAPDPCATIAALHDRMPNVTISVVGIAIPADEVAEIACFAELTGGLYLRAAEGSGFRANLRQALEEAWGEPALPPAAMPVAQLVVPANVVQGARFTVAYQGPLDPRDEIRISWFGTSPREHLVGALIHADGTPVTLTAPAERGAYELRYWHAARGTVIASARLQVEAIAPALDAPATVQQGQTFDVAWLADAMGGETVQLARPTTAVDVFVGRAELRRSVATVTLTAPAEAGRYEIRLVRAIATVGVEPEIRGNAEERILARRTIEVVPAHATLETGGPVVAGAAFEVAWTGPGGLDDDIVLARPNMPPGEALLAERAAGETVRFVAPFPAGRYELRYWSAVLNAVVATAIIDVTAPAATLDAPGEVRGGATFEVAWTGPGDLGDRIVLAPAEPEGAMPVLVAALSVFDRALRFDAPTAPGAYELRYLAGPEGEVIARRRVNVTEASAGLRVDGPIDAGAPFEIAWEGPAGRFDEIRLSPFPGDPSNPLTAVRVAEGEVARLVAPDAPGVYLLTYWAGGTGAPLASITVTVGLR